MSQANIVQLTSGTEEGLIRRCAALYCQIWREPPWNEDFWEVEKVIEKVRLAIDKDGFVGYLAIVDKEVVGFTWGYSVDEISMRQICGHNRLDGYIKTGDFYLAELGVTSNNRGEGVGFMLSNRLLDEVGAGCSVILRTDTKATVAIRLYSKLGFRELNIKDKRHPTRTYRYRQYRH